MCVGVHAHLFWRGIYLQNAVYKMFVFLDKECYLKLLPQVVQPIANLVHFHPDAYHETSLSNVCSLFNKKCLFFSKSSKEFTSVFKSGKDQNSGYPKRSTHDKVTKFHQG